MNLINVVKIASVLFLLAPCSLSEEKIDFGWKELKPKSKVIEVEGETYFAYSIEEKLKLENKNRRMYEELKYFRRRVSSLEEQLPKLLELYEKEQERSLALKDEIIKTHKENSEFFKEMALSKSKDSAFSGNFLKSLTNLPTLLLLGTAVTTLR